MWLFDALVWSVIGYEGEGNLELEAVEKCRRFA